MKLTTLIHLAICILFVDLNYASSDIDELKKNSKIYLSEIKMEFVSIKNKIISPYNKKRFPYKTHLDSLHFLSEKLDTRRKNLFSDLRDLDLTSKDIQFFDKLNRESILIYNVINLFGKIYYNYLSYNKINRDYSFEKITSDIKNLIVLEKKLFSKTVKFEKR